MPTRQTDPLNGIYKVLGELEADVRTIKHSQNNTSAKIDAISVLVERVDDLAKAKADHEQRLHLLEGESERRKGAVSVAQWFANHWPFTIILTGLAIVWAWLSGRHA
jgi:hypothetical protein